MHTAEAKLKMSLAKKGKHYPKMSEAKRGHKMSLKTRLALRKANLGHHRIGWKWSEEQKKNLKGFRGDSSNPMWKGGICKSKEYVSWLKNKRNRSPKIGSHTFEEWENLKRDYHFTCLCCGRAEPEIKLTKDHIIPLSKGGSDSIKNIQPLCKQCNCHKQTNTIKY